MFRKTLLLAVTLTLALTACSSAQNTQGNQGSQPGMAGNGKLNDMSELIIGTLKLDGTANAVSKEQAAALVPMWQVYKQLMTSDTAAQEEITGLGKQIKGTMTSEQLKAISKLSLTQADLMSYMQQAGPSGSGSAQANGNSTSRGNNSGGGMPGGMPGGGPGGMPGGMPGGPGDFGGPQTRASGTQTANGTPRAPGAGMNRVPSVLIDTLIQYLKKVSAS